jgi:PDZ domain
MSRVGMWMLAAAIAASPAVAQNDSEVAGQHYSIGSREGWLGMGVSCSQCSFDTSGNRDGAGRWTFSASPSVFSVDDNGPADRAGLRAGDTLLAIDGVPLITAEGGAAFGSVRPGQKVTLRYRRGGSDHTAILTAGAHTYRLTAQLQQLQRQLQRRQAEAMAEAQRQMEQAQRHMQQTQTQLQLQQQYLQQVLQQMERARAASPAGDSTGLESLRLYAQQLDSAAAQWRVADSAYAVLAAPAVPAPFAATAPAAPLAAVAPAAPLAAVAPAAPLAAVAPAAPVAALAPVAPIPPRAWYREAGPLRYSGRLGDVIIEARGEGAVTTTEASDSVVVVTSRDVSVRISLRPVRAPRPRAAAPAPAAAPSPRPPQP